MKLEKILVPVDYSEGSKEALAFAIDLAREFNASIEVLHIVDSRSISYVAYSGTMITRLLETLEHDLRQMIAGVDTKGVRIEASVSDRFGVPHAEILEEAKSRGVDLIVLGTHGRTGISHALLGSVAEKVVRLAPCPVLTVRMKSS
ncbi:MAG: universal stress protein [Candidatus Tectomicrobia bacterium]|nr:universal stress protein [Candidatus Tectomicrobia bacterium]